MLRLDDMIEAAERVRSVLGDMSLDELEADWQRHRLLQRGVEIISEASRHLLTEPESRHPEIPWTKVAGIGNFVTDTRTSPHPFCGNLCAKIYPSLKKVCRDERKRASE